MTTITSSTPIRNGIDTAQVYGTLDVLRAQPEAARFEFRVRNRWIDGTHSRSTIHGFWGAGAEDVSRAEPFIVDAGEPLGEGDQIRAGRRVGAQFHRRPQLTSARTLTGTPLVIMS